MIFVRGGYMLDIGIIGGADGPTVVIVTGDVWVIPVLIAVLIIAAVGVVLFIKKKRKK